MVNTASIAVAHVPTPGGAVEYEGDARIDGVPGTAAPIPIDFLDVAGLQLRRAASRPAPLVDRIDGIEVTCIDNGMPVVIMRAADLGKRGDESPEELEADAALKARVEQHPPRARAAHEPRRRQRRRRCRRCAWSSPPRGTAALIDTRTFIPHRVHEAIGVLGARQRRHRLRHAGLGGRAGGAACPRSGQQRLRDRASDRILHRRDGRDA